MRGSPKKAAVRAIAPRLCGLLTPSRISSGCASRAQRSAASGLKTWVVAAAPGRYRELAELRGDNKPFALVLGNEEEGLPAATLAACDDVVAIPGRGRIQSLNVAASAAILLYVLSAASPPPLRRQALLTSATTSQS
jgi:tRNA G18 (ribose-2'-O)-methylase SpoU